MAKNEKEVKKNSYFKEMRAELKKVVWPTPKELFNNTVAVIVFVIITAVIVFVFDLCFDSLNKYGIVKLQEKVQTSLKVEDENTENEEEASEEDNSQDTDTEAEVSTEADVVLEDATTEQNSEDSSTTETENQTETVPEE